MSDYAIDDSEYQRLQRENERLKAERELAVRVAWDILPTETLNHLGEDGLFHVVTYADIRKVLEWYDELTEAQDAANDDGAR